MSGAADAMRGELRPLGLYRLGSQSLIDCELEAYAAGLDLFFQRAGELLRGALVLTAEPPALNRYESLLGFIPNQSLGLQARRELILYRLSVAPYDFNLAGMLGSLRAAGLEAEIREDYAREFLSVSSLEYLDHFVDLDDLKKKARAMLPAHLETDFDIGFMTWDLFGGVDRSWDSLDTVDSDWNQAEMFGHLLTAESVQDGGLTAKSAGEN